LSIDNNDIGLSEGDQDLDLLEAVADTRRKPLNATEFTVKPSRKLLQGSRSAINLKTVNQAQK